MEQKKPKTLKSVFVEHWLMGLFFQVLVLLVSCLIANIIGMIAGGGKGTNNLVAVIMAAILGAGASFFASTWADLPYDVETCKDGIAFKKAFSCILPDLAMFVFFLATMIGIRETIFILSSVIAASLLHWLIWFIVALYRLWQRRCPKCKRIFTLISIDTSTHYDPIEQETNYHAGSGVIGSVYDSKGNKVGDLKGNTGYTTTHNYQTRTDSTTFQCKCCGETVKQVSYSRHRVN